MKSTIFIILLLLLLNPGFTFAQLEKVTVETYYISDDNDSTDITDGRMLQSGSTTYRVYIDLKPGYKLTKIYGDAKHTLRISSTADFFNNIDRPNAYFGYLINKSWFSNNPTLGLDSWLTLGLATKTNYGVLKSEDTNGSFIGGNNNSGGSAAVPGGILINADTKAGVPLTTEDGMLPFTNSTPQFVDNGFKDLVSGIDTTVFGSVNTGSQFISNDAYLLQNSGIGGADPDSNKILVAQLTTKGIISFELNIEVIDSVGNLINYIAKGQNTQAGDTLVSAFLTYPPSCGCTDPNYLEYSPSYACGINDSCKTHIKFGCKDSLACNFDDDANFSLPALCCYPGYCNDRNIAIVCPELNIGRLDNGDIVLYPNPAKNQISFSVSTGKNQQTKYCIIDKVGRVIFEKNTGVVSDLFTEQADISGIENGVYIIRLYVGDAVISKRFIKE